MSPEGERDKNDPGGPLFVTPAGSVTVATDALLAACDRLAALEHELLVDERRVLAADACPAGWPVPDDVLSRLRSARELCATSREGYLRAADNYAVAERMLERAHRDLAGVLAATVGADVLAMLARFVLFMPGAAALAALVGWAAIPDTGDGRLETVKRFFLAHPELITSPEFVRFVQHAATSLDDAALGLAGVPGWAALIPRPPGSEPAGGALSVASLGVLIGMLRESPVHVERVRGERHEGAPSGVLERLNRIPEGDQVRIERYDADGMPPRYVVYVGPTETFSPLPTDEPWDMASNVYGVAGASPGSLRAVELAMADAGITAADEVVVTGFSQGGLIATLVTASGDWNVVGLETHGAPAGNIPVPEGVAGLAVRNTDDLVPALAGPQLDDTLVQVERRAFRDDEGLPTHQAAPAHQRTAYARTAAAIDDAQSTVVREQVARLDAFTAEYLQRGGSVTALTYHAERTW